MKRRLMTGVAILAAMTLAMGGAALAEEVVDEVDGEEPTKAVPQVDAQWDDVQGVVIIATEDGACDGVTVTRGEDGEGDEGDLEITVVDDEGGAVDEAPENCFVVDVKRDDGKENHGSVVSGVARELSPHDLPVPKGWIMRKVAKLGGPLDETVVDEPEPDMPESEVDDEAADDPDADESKGKAKGHEKRAEKAKQEREGKPEKPEKPGKPEKAAKPDKPGKPEKPNHPGKGNKPTKP